MLCQELQQRSSWSPDLTQHRAAESMMASCHTAVKLLAEMTARIGSNRPSLRLQHYGEMLPLLLARRSRRPRARLPVTRPPQSPPTPMFSMLLA